jgi:hypothetical protein
VSSAIKTSQASATTPKSIEEAAELVLKELNLAGLAVHRPELPGSLAFAEVGGVDADLRFRVHKSRPGLRKQRLTHRAAAVVEEWLVTWGPSSSRSRYSKPPGRFNVKNVAGKIVKYCNTRLEYSRQWTERLDRRCSICNVCDEIENLCGTASDDQVCVTPDHRGEAIEVTVRGLERDQAIQVVQDYLLRKKGWELQRAPLEGGPNEDDAKLLECKNG